MTGIYLDYNGSAPVDPRVVDAVASALTDGVGNASSVHAFGRGQAALVDVSRDQVAALVGGRARDVVFTAGATEANNLVLQGLVESAPEGRSRVLISAVEHASVRATAAWLAEHGRAKVEIVPVTAGGFVDLEAFEAMLGDDVRLVSIMAANSETGVLNDLAPIASMAHEHGALVHADATQIVGRLEFNLETLGVDVASISAHKICGPGGVGALIGTQATKNQLRPLLHGGGHERGLRSGSLNVAGIVGFGTAADLAHAGQAAESIRLGELRDQLVAGVLAGLDDVTENGDPSRRLPNTANLCFAAADAQAVLVNLDPVAVSTGSACSSGVIEPSPVLLAMGIDRQAADESLRFSVGRFTTTDEIAEAVTRTIDAVRFVRSKSGRT